VIPLFCLRPIEKTEKQVKVLNEAFEAKDVMLLINAVTLGARES